ncbi:MAG: phosphotransferase [Promethearchaeota archaeon]
MAEINGEYIFRFPRHPDAQKWLEIEIEILPMLRGNVSLAVPQFDYICRNNPDFPWTFVGYPKIAGVPMTKSLLTPSTWESSAKQLGEFLSQLHNYPLKSVKQVQVPYFTALQWRNLYKTFYQEIKAEAFSVLDLELQTQLTTRFETFLQDERNFHFKSTLIHRDLCEDHILWDQQSERITGIIDWNDVSVGDPAYDFSGLLTHYGEAFIQHIMDHYQGPTDNSTINRIRFYSQTSWCYCILHALRVKDHQLLQESVQSLEKMLLHMQK